MSNWRIVVVREGQDATLFGTPKRQPARPARASHGPQTPRQVIRLAVRVSKPSGRLAGHFGTHRHIVQVHTVVAYRIGVGVGWGNWVASVDHG